MSSIMIRRLRRVTQLFALILLAIIPWIDGFRMDLADGYFVILGRQFPVNQLFLLVVAFVLSVVLLALFARTFGRLFCGWACPQTFWSEFGGTIVERMKKWKKMKRFSDRKLKLTINILIRVVFAVPLIWLFYSILVSYFVSPSKIVVWFSEGPPIWFVFLGIKFSVVAFIDLLIIRHSFCHSICPYGLIQKFSQKNKVLKVTFNPDQCVDCNLCDMACPMDLYPRGITPKDSCISCQECVVACGTRAEKYKEQKRDFGTENCLAMTFKPHEPTLKEKFDGVSIGLLTVSLIMTAIIVGTVLLDDGLSIKMAAATSSESITEIANNGEQLFGQHYSFEIENHSQEDRDFTIKVHDQFEQLTFSTVPESVEVAANSSWKDQLVIFIDTEGVEPGRFIIWVDVYSNGEVVDSLKSVFYYQP